MFQRFIFFSCVNCLCYTVVVCCTPKRSPPWVGDRGFLMNLTKAHRKIWFWDAYYLFTYYIAYPNPKNHAETPNVYYKYFVFFLSRPILKNTRLTTDMYSTISTCAVECEGFPPIFSSNLQLKIIFVPGRYFFSRMSVSFSNVIMNIITCYIGPIKYN